VELSGLGSEGLVQPAIEVTDRLDDVELLLGVYDSVPPTAVARLDDELAGEVVEDLRAQPIMDAQRLHQVVLTDPLGDVVPDTDLVGDLRVGLVVAVELAEVDLLLVRARVLEVCAASEPLAEAPAEPLPPSPEGELPLDVATGAGCGHVQSRV
jgi:hypothetical protein